MPEHYGKEPPVKPESEAECVLRKAGFVKVAEGSWRRLKKEDMATFKKSTWTDEDERLLRLLLKKKAQADVFFDSHDDRQEE